MRIIIVSKNQIIIKKVEKIHQHKTLAERLKSFEGEYETEEWDTGEHVGKEIW